jgi:hypothetical protein
LHHATAEGHSAFAGRGVLDVDAVGWAAKCGTYGGGERKDLGFSGGSDWWLSVEHTNKDGKI